MNDYCDIDYLTVGNTVQKEKLDNTFIGLPDIIYNKSVVQYFLKLNKEPDFN